MIIFYINLIQFSNNFTRRTYNLLGFEMKLFLKIFTFVKKIKKIRKLNINNFLNEFNSRFSNDFDSKNLCSLWDKPKMKISILNIQRELRWLKILARSTKFLLLHGSTLFPEHSLKPNLTFQVESSTRIISLPYFT